MPSPESLPCLSPNKLATFRYGDFIIITSGLGTVNLLWIAADDAVFGNQGIGLPTKRTYRTMSTLPAESTPYVDLEISAQLPRSQ